ncbi:MAG: TetR/AcrR family transcriptional regulator [Dehalococcoidia bacterium]|jgi:AcrR family transcriptional regulator|nr:TetR/AcrR family transcriptional regulator [Dehalococcoidia bacterium]
MAEQATEDRRVRRTKQRLKDALNELIVEKGYDRVTVQDLIDRADVGRSTFYAHYDTKDDLMMSQLGPLQEQMGWALGSDRALTESVVASLPLFEHIAEHHEEFRAMIGSRGIALAEEAVHSALLEHIGEELRRRERQGERHAVPVDARAGFLAGSLMAFATWWLENGMPYSAAQMDEMFQELTRTA